MPDELDSAQKEYILFCDESDKQGKYFSNFYGGVLVGATDYMPVTARLNDEKNSLNLLSEVKWQKVTGPYLAKYKALMDSFFAEVKAGRVKVRVMFTHNAVRAIGLSRRQQAETYWLLYYQFVKHGFGFAHMPDSPHERRLRIYFDQFPDTGEQAAKFKGYIEGLDRSWQFRKSGMRVRREAIAEVASHDHVLLQCMDVVLGSINFRLNDKHKVKPQGSRRRGARTVAKDELRKHILYLIQQMRPNFNIGVSTGCNEAERWSLPYRHWCFKPAEFEIDATLTKRARKKNPTGST